MFANLPTWAQLIARGFIVGLGIAAVIVLIYAASEYLDAATGMLPGGGEG